MIGGVFMLIRHHQIQKNRGGARNFFLAVLPLIIFGAALLLAPPFFSAMRENAACDWEEGWNAWQRGNAAEALSCWSRHRFCAKFHTRPARLFFWRARALDKLGRRAEAEEQRRALARLYPYDFYAFLIRADGGSQLRGNDDARRTSALFNPRPWPAEVRNAALTSGVSENMIWSLMKRESKFDPRALSRNGAVGLMQLMPDTAAEDARLLKMSAFDIGTPELNILLGAKHFSVLERKFADEPPRAVAAYNAGSASVSRWGTLGAEDWAAWIESIPYAQTREFVRSVLENAEIYRLVYGAPAGTEQLSQLASKRPSELAGR